MKPIKAWVTEDNKIFGSEDEARRREIEIKLEEIEQYMREARRREIKKTDIKLDRFKNLELARDTLDELEELFMESLNSVEF